MWVMSLPSVYVGIPDVSVSPQMEALFGSLPEMLDFQRVFLQTLEERIASCPNLSSLETPKQFKVRWNNEFFDVP